jgi:hypothetical protein
MAAKKRQTMGKLMRERERAEKRARKQEKKEAKKAAALAAREGGTVDPAQAETNGQNDETGLTPNLEPEANSPDPPLRAVDERDDLLR